MEIRNVHKINCINKMHICQERTSSNGPNLRKYEKSQKRIRKSMNIKSLLKTWREKIWVALLPLCKY